MKPEECVDTANVKTATEERDDIGNRRFGSGISGSSHRMESK
jgi:hypothetical protein